MPGKRGFDAAREALGSRVEALVGDFMAIGLDELGQYDVVLYLGVLCHMKNPLTALERLANVTRELAVIETTGVAVPGFEELSLSEIYESDELNHDATNWWSLNLGALHGMCRAAGFRKVETHAGPGDLSQLPAGEVRRYRPIVHAWK